MIAPLSHIHSVAELDDATLAEFLAVFEIVKLSLRRQYNTGYTAYEHGRVGACRVLEVHDDLSTFCHHAHRIVIPRATNCASEIGDWFEANHELANPEQLQQFATQEYVYYETGQEDRFEIRRVFTGHKGIPSQFMRRILTTSLDLGHDWNWVSDLNYEGMIDTVAHLRAELSGLVLAESPRIPLTPVKLQTSVSIDGLAYVGKTTIAKALAQCSGRPMIDSGLIFRFMALRKINGQPEPSADEVESFFLESQNLPLRTAKVTAEAATLARSPERRRYFSTVLRQIISDLHPCILVGRDGWRFMGESDIQVVIDADIDTRIKRALLRSALEYQNFQDMLNLREVIELTDASDRVNLPSADAAGVLRINNGARPFSATMNEFLSKMEVVK
jgi:CMP/dCMP kinase